MKKGTKYTAGTIIYALTAAIVLSVAGCTSKQEKNDMAECQAIIDDYAEIILLQDKDSAHYDSALSAVKSYLDDTAQEQKTKAMGQIEGIITLMETDSRECTSYEAADTFAQMLEKHGISLAEYQMNADSRYTYLQDYIQDLTYLQEYVSYADESEAYMKDLQTYYEFALKEQQLMRSYNYIGINYWFAGWNADAAAYVRQAVLDRLVSFSGEDVQWQDSREAVESSMNACLDQLEELYNEWTAEIGASWEAQNHTENTQ